MSNKEKFDKVKDDELAWIRTKLSFVLEQHQNILKSKAAIEANDTLSAWEKSYKLEHCQNKCRIRHNKHNGKFSCEIKSWWKEGSISRDYDNICLDLADLDFHSQITLESHYERGPGNYDTGRGSSISLQNSDFMMLIEDLNRLFTHIDIHDVAIDAFVKNVSGAVLEKALFRS